MSSDKQKTDDESKAEADAPKFSPEPTFKNFKEASGNIKPYCDYLKSIGAATRAGDKEVTNILQAILSIYYEYEVEQGRLADMLVEEGFTRKCRQIASAMIFFSSSQCQFVGSFTTPLSQHVVAYQLDHV